MDNYSINYLLKVDRFISTDSKDVFSMNHLTLALSRTSFMTESLLIQEFLPDLHKSLILNWVHLISKVKHMHIKYGYLPGFSFLFFFLTLKKKWRNNSNCLLSILTQLRHNLLSNAKWKRITINNISKTESQSWNNFLQVDLVT